MKIKISKADLLMAKSFLNYSYPPFVEELELDMDIDYIAGLCRSFVKKRELQYKLSDLSQEQISKIKMYLKNKGTPNDVIFYESLLSVQLLLRKYYNYNGTFKSLQGELNIK